MELADLRLDERLLDERLVLGLRLDERLLDERLVLGLRLDGCWMTWSLRICANPILSFFPLFAVWNVVRAFKKLA